MQALTKSSTFAATARVTRTTARASPVAAAAVVAKAPNGMRAALRGHAVSTAPRSPAACAAARTPSQIRATATEAAQGLSLPINLEGKKAFVAGVADDQGFGWAISKALAQVRRLVPFTAVQRIRPPLGRAMPTSGMSDPSGRRTPCGRDDAPLMHAAFNEGVRCVAVRWCVRCVPRSCSICPRASNCRPRQDGPRATSGGPYRRFAPPHE